MHIKMKLFTHKLHEGGSVLNHILFFKESDIDLQPIEVQYDDADLGLILLCSLPSSLENFRDIILLTLEYLTSSEVYEALQQSEKMKIW
jgi:hypothetical protein